MEILIIFIIILLIDGYHFFNREKDEERIYKKTLDPSWPNRKYWK